jgi:hypothetical protein
MIPDIDKKELVARVIPDTPTLKNEGVELTGFAKLLNDYQMGLIERKGLVEQRQILSLTKLQLLRDRTNEIITAYRYQATAARIAFIKEAEEYVNYIMDQASIRIADNKVMAIKKAVENFADLMLGIREDLSPELANKIKQSGELLLDKTIDEIFTSSFDIEKATQEYYPKKRTL